MNNRKKVWLSTGVATVLLLSTTACGKDDNPSTSDPSKAEAKKDPIELVFYYPATTTWTTEEFDRVFAQPIQKKFPHITVKYLLAGVDGSIQNLLTAGQTIDVLLTSTGFTPPTLLASGLQYDISVIVKANKYDLKRFPSSFVEATDVMGNGGIYGLPVLNSPAAMYYNKDVFDRFGVLYPKDGITWDETYELTRKLTRSDSGTQYYGFASSYTHQVTMNQWSMPSVDLTTLKSTFDTNERWKSWVENLVRFYKIPGYEKLQRNQLSFTSERDRFFKDRNIAMITEVTSLHKKDVLDGMNWDIASYPVFSGSNIGPQPYPTLFYVTSMNKYKEDTFQALAYLTSDEFQMQQSRAGSFLTALTNPEVRGAFSQEDPLYRGKNIKALWPLVYAKPVQFNEYNTTDMSYEMEVGIKDVILNLKDMNTFLSDAAERSKKRIENVQQAKK